MSFVQVDTNAFREAMKKAGFVKQDYLGTEEVYERPHRLRPDLRIRIYSTIYRGKARSKGLDAIRVSLCWVDPTPGAEEYGPGLYGLAVSSFKHVHRTGSTEAVIRRTLQRAREAYVLANTMEHCTCGSWMYPHTDTSVIPRRCVNALNRGVPHALRRFHRTDDFSVPDPDPNNGAEIGDV